MSSGEFDLPVPDSFISPKSLVPLEGPNIQSFYDYSRMLSRLQKLSFNNYRLRDVNFLYKPSNVLGSLFYPSLPFLEIPYQVLAGIINGQVRAGDLNGETSERVKVNIIKGLGSILRFSWVSSQRRVSWGRPNTIHDHDNIFNSSQLHPGNELVTARFNQRSWGMSFLWYEVHPAFLHNFEYREYSLIAELASHLRRDSFTTGTMILKMDVNEVKWIVGNRGKPVMGPNVPILRNYLEPHDNRIQIAEGDIWQLRALQRNLMETLGIGFLSSESPT